MQQDTLHKGLYLGIPLFFSCVICIVLAIALGNKAIDTPAFAEQLKEITVFIVAISGILIILLALFIINKVFKQKGNRSVLIDSRNKWTQKMHYFRNIVEILMESKMWLPGLKAFIDDEFDGLTFFEVKDFYKGKSKLAIDFLQENHPYADSENLYLELKSLLFTHPNQRTVPLDVEFPRVYNVEMVDKWLKHKCGTGLWYFFGYKFGFYKEALDIEGIHERYQDNIMSLANQIDNKIFEDSSFNEIFLSKLGEYATNEILPNLLYYQEAVNTKIPRSVKILYVLFVLLCLVGLILPLLFFLFNLPIMSLIISFSFVISTVFFISSTFIQFLSGQVDN